MTAAAAAATEAAAAAAPAADRSHAVNVRRYVRTSGQTAGRAGRCAACNVRYSPMLLDRADHTRVSCTPELELAARVRTSRVLEMRIELNSTRTEYSNIHNPNKLLILAVCSGQGRTVPLIFTTHFT